MIKRIPESISPIMELCLWYIVLDSSILIIPELGIKHKLPPPLSLCQDAGMSLYYGIPVLVFSVSFCQKGFIFSNANYFFIKDLPGFRISPHPTLMATRLIWTMKHILLTSSWRKLKRSMYVLIQKIYSFFLKVNYRGWHPPGTWLRHWDWRGHLMTA